MEQPELLRCRRAPWGEEGVWEIRQRYLTRSPPCGGLSGGAGVPQSAHWKTAAPAEGAGD